MWVLRQFIPFIIKVYNLINEKYTFSVHNDINFGCRNMVSESEFLLFYNEKYTYKNFEK